MLTREKAKFRSASLIFIMFVVVALGMTSASYSLAPIQKGDVNKDGVLDEKDIFSLVDIILKKTRLTEKETIAIADVNTDGNINVFDLVSVRNMANVSSMIRSGVPVILNIKPTGGATGSSLDLHIFGANLANVKVNIDPPDGIHIKSISTINPENLVVSISIGQSSVGSSRYLTVVNQQNKMNVLLGWFNVVERPKFMKVVHKGKIIVPKKPKDSDNDGVPDWRDECPYTSGTRADGCPEGTKFWERDWIRPGPIKPGDWDKEANNVVDKELEAGIAEPGDVVEYNIEEQENTVWKTTYYEAKSPWKQVGGPTPEGQVFLLLTEWCATYSRQVAVTDSEFRVYWLIKIVNGVEKEVIPYYEETGKTRITIAVETKKVCVILTGEGANELVNARAELPDDPTEQPFGLLNGFTDRDGRSLPPKGDDVR